MTSTHTGEKWRDIGVRDKFQLINGTVLIIAAITLYFLAFIITLSIGFDVISAGATMLASGLACFGIASFFKNQLVEFEAKLYKRIDEKYEERMAAADTAN